MFDINFPIFAKGAVIVEENDNLPDVWKFLSGKIDEYSINIFHLQLFCRKTEPPSWNFWKYLIDPNGKVVQAYSPQTNVRQMYPDITKLLVQHNLVDRSDL